MNAEDHQKQNILHKVNKKLRIKNIKIALFTILGCLITFGVTYYFIFVSQNPWDAKDFSNIRIERKIETINQVSNEELLYNHFIFTSNKSLYNVNMNFYLEKNEEDDTTSLYFYMSQSRYEKYLEEKHTRDFIDLAEQNGAKYEEFKDIEILLYPKLCNTDLDTTTKEISKVYYFVYDYQNMKKEKFEQAKKDAILLWEK